MNPGLLEACRMQAPRPRAQLWLLLSLSCRQLVAASEFGEPDGRWAKQQGRPEFPISAMEVVEMATETRIWVALDRSDGADSVHPPAAGLHRPAGPGADQMPRAEWVREAVPADALPPARGSPDGRTDGGRALSRARCGGPSPNPGFTDRGSPQPSMPRTIAVARGRAARQAAVHRHDQPPPPGRAHRGRRAARGSGHMSRDPALRRARAADAARQVANLPHPRRATPRRGFSWTPMGSTT